MPASAIGYYTFLKGGAMSLLIDIDKVTGVCIAGHWHDVQWVEEGGGEERSTFLFDSYEFVTKRGYEDKWPPYHLEHGGGESETCAKGFEFMDAETGSVIAGPFTSIDAVMTQPY